MVAIHLASTPSDPTAIDLFCGAGGLTTGAEESGLRTILGVNHWTRACETFATNHADAQVECADLQKTAPERYQGYQADILLGSPECKKHSNGQGKQRTNARQLRLFYSCEYDAEAIRSRATMYEMQHFLAAYRYRYVVLENVVEALFWDQFPTWLQAMDNTNPGYSHRLLFLNSMFFGAPQSRDRMYIVFWRNDMPAPDLTFEPQAYCWQCQANIDAQQSWKDPLKRYGKYGRNGQYTYRCPRCGNEVLPFFLPAVTAIDWSIPATRIRDRTEPLAAATLARIDVGLSKWRAELAMLRQWQMDPRADVPTTAVASAGAVAAPQVVEFRHHMSTRSMFAALSTITAQAEHHGVLTPPGWQAQFGTGAIEDAGDAVTGQNPFASLPPPMLVKVDRTRQARPATTEPCWTITGGGNHHFLWLPSWLVPYYGSTRSLHDCCSHSTGTMTGDDRFGLLAAKEQEFARDGCSFRMLDPTEVQRAMAFADTYRVLGNRREIVHQLGNAVTPPIARWIVDRILEAMTGRPRSFDPGRHILSIRRDLGYAWGMAC